VGRRLLAWWYCSIAAGFLLLALRAILFRGEWRLIALRCVIAAGFAALAWLEFSGRMK
jgi:hypothetical protein